MSLAGTKCFTCEILLFDIEEKETVVAYYCVRDCRMGLQKLFCYVKGQSV